MRVYEEGKLILDFVDATTQVLIWRGSVQTELPNSSSPQERDDRIGKAVRLMLERFPPDT